MSFVYFKMVKKSPGRILVSEKSDEEILEKVSNPDEQESMLLTVTTVS